MVTRQSTYKIGSGAGSRDWGSASNDHEERKITFSFKGVDKPIIYNQL